MNPDPFDSIVPDWAPGTARQATYISGVAELATAGLLASPRTRKWGGLATVILMVAVWPGNFEMARQWSTKPWPWQIISIGRLPLQLPLIAGGWKIFRAEKNKD